MMNDNSIKKPGVNNQQKNATSSERLATCSMIAGLTGLICSFFYFPASLYSNSSTPTGLLCGVIGIILAIMSGRVDMNEKKKLNPRAITGIVLSVIAIALTLFFFYLLACYYETLRDPVLGPQFNEFIKRLQEQINQQMHLSGSILKIG